MGVRTRLGVRAQAPTQYDGTCILDVLWPKTRFMGQESPKTSVGGRRREGRKERSDPKLSAKRWPWREIGFSPSPKSLHVGGDGKGGLGTS